MCVDRPKCANLYDMRENLSYRHFGLDRYGVPLGSARVVAAASSSSTSSVWTGPSPGLGCESGACWQGGGPGGRVGPGARRGRRRRAGAIRGVPDSGPTPENRSTDRIGSSVSPAEGPKRDPRLERAQTAWTRAAPIDDLDVSGLTQEVPAVVERARARWGDVPKHPAYARPAPPPRRRNRGGQGAAQEASTETAEETQAQQQTLRLF